MSRLTFSAEKDAPRSTDSDRTGEPSRLIESPAPSAEEEPGPELPATSQERRFRALVSYDGGDYFGWQLQPEDQTIQGELERALKAIVQRDVRVHGAGRTDSGVHALGQVASFKTVTAIPVDRLRSALNWHLPAGIRIHALEEAPHDFHARFDAHWREYAYVVVQQSSPFTRRYAHTVRGSVDLARMNEACRPLLGEHDFRAFTTQPKGPYGCRLHAAEWREMETTIVFQVRSSRFLYRMVRFLVGACLEVGRDRLPVDALARLLASGNRRQGPGPAPAHALYLVAVGYDPGWPTVEVPRAIGPLGLRVEPRG